jgi:hypothetical protein
MTLCAEDEANSITYNLGKYGIKFIGTRLPKNPQTLHIEELIIEVLSHKQNPRFVEVLPALMYKNNVDYQRLAALAIKQNLANEAGYVLNATRDISGKFGNNSNDSNLVKAIAQLEKNIDASPHPLAKHNFDDAAPYFELCRERQTADQRKWNVFGLIFYSDFLNQARAYCAG